MISSRYKAVVIGVSAGGIVALGKLLPELEKDFPLPIIIVQHLAPSRDVYHVEYFRKLTGRRVKEAEDKEEIKNGTIYFAAANYHLLIERDKTFSFSGEEKVNFSRPSVDVLFESAAKAYQKSLIGIVLTGANADGAEGLALLKEYGGLTVVQDPEEAEISFMPKAALAACRVDHVLELVGIAKLLNESLSEENISIIKDKR